MEIVGRPQTQRRVTHFSTNHTLPLSLAASYASPARAPLPSRFPRAHAHLTTNLQLTAAQQMPIAATGCGHNSKNSLKTKSKEGIASTGSGQDPKSITLQRETAKVRSGYTKMTNFQPRNSYVRLKKCSGNNFSAEGIKYAFIDLLIMLLSAPWMLEGIA